MGGLTIVERLRALDDETMCFDGPATYALIAEAADTIEALTAEVERQEKLVRVYRDAQLRAEQKLCRAEGNAQGWKLRAERLEAILAKSQAPISGEVL